MFPLIYRITDTWVCQTLRFLNIYVIENFMQIYYIYIFSPHLLFYTHAHLYIHHTQNHTYAHHTHTHIHNTQTHTHNLLSLWNFDHMYVRCGLTSWDWTIIRELVPFSIPINCLQFFTSGCGPGRLPHPCIHVRISVVYVTAWVFVQMTMWLRFHGVSSCHIQNTLSHTIYPGPLTLKIFLPLLSIIYFIFLLKYNYITSFSFLPFNFSHVPHIHSLMSRNGAVDVLLGLGSLSLVDFYIRNSCKQF